MNKDFEDAIREVKDHISKLESQKVRFAIELEAADAAIDRASKALQEEFGVKTAADVEARQKELEDKLRSALERAKEALEKTE